MDHVYVVQDAYYYRKESESNVVGVYKSLDNSWEKVLSLSKDISEDYDDLDNSHIKHTSTPIPPFEEIEDIFNGSGPEHTYTSGIFDNNYINGLTIYPGKRIERTFFDCNTTHEFTIYYYKLE